MCIRDSIHTTNISEVMTVGGKNIRQSCLAVEALRLMEAHGITGLLVLNDKDHLVGALNIHDLFRAGVM